MDLATTQVITTATLAAFAVYIAWRQSETAANKLKLDLFDKRFAIWVRYTKFIDDTLQLTATGLDHPNWEMWNYNAYMNDVAAVRFLFGANVQADVSGFALLASRWRMALYERAASYHTDAQIKSNNAERAELLRKMAEMRDRSTAIFEPYLSFAHLHLSLIDEAKTLYKNAGAA